MTGIDSSGLQTLLDELRAKHGVVGATLGVLKNGAIAAAGSGKANLATGVDCTADTVFQIGSIGKVFTTTLIMQLVDEGRLELEDPVTKHIREFMLRDPRAARAVTVRQLLNHTSGMDGDFFAPDDPEGPSTASYVRKLGLLPNLYPPGEGPITYSNSGFVVAGRIVELLTGMTWQTAVMERIVKPLGLPAAFAHPHEALRYRSAMGHVPDPKQPGGSMIAPVTYLPISMAAAGSVLSMSVESLLLFARAQIADGAYGDGKQLLNAKSAVRMRDDTTALPANSPGELTHWGLGWMESRTADYTMVGHDGGTIGHFTYLRCFPHKGVAFALLTNSPSMKLFKDVQAHMMEALVGAPLKPDVAADPAFTPNLDRYTGTYATVATRFEVETEDGHLKVRSVSAMAPEMRATLEPFREDMFTIRAEGSPLDGEKLVFLDDAGGGKAKFIRAGLRMAKRR